MSTLADELLKDFADSDDEGGDNQQDAFAGGAIDMDALGFNDSHEAETSDDRADAEDEDAEMVGIEGDATRATEDPEEIEKMQLGAAHDVRTVAFLIKRLAPVLEKIAQQQSTPSASADVGNIEDHPEYQLLTQSNRLSTSIDGEIALVHKFIRDHYSIRFPELETLVVNRVQYAKVVAILGNGPFDTDRIKTLQKSTENPLGVTLKSVLDGPSLMTVTVEATTSKGRAMSPNELERVIRACEMIISLDKAKKTLTEYVQSCMNIFAPNLTALLGSLTAAQLLNAAGGLTALSKAPSCNLTAWGSKKQVSSAMATNIGIRHQGYLYQSPIVRCISGEDTKKRALKRFANKAVMCARMDCFHQFRDGSEGERLREEVLENLEKANSKPLNRGTRALPAPDDKPSRKRGGRRARKAKEAMAMTDLRKQQNRMAFGKEEKEIGYGTGDSTTGLGMIGARDDGRLRVAQIDNRTRAKLSAKSKGWGGATSVNSGGATSLKAAFGAGNISLAGAGPRAAPGISTLLGGATAGIVSSLAFTPMQGLELVDPKVQAELKRKREVEEDRWFKGGTFTQLGGGPAERPATNGGDGVFKKPDLPASKRQKAA